MPVTIKNTELFFKDENGEYVGINAVSEKKIADEIAEMDAAGTSIKSAIETKGRETRASIPADYTALSSAFKAGDDVANLNSSFINYGYDVPFYKPATGTSWSDSLEIKRSQAIVELSRETVPSGQVYIRVSGDVALYSTNASVDSWESGFELIDGHVYRAKATLISGTSQYEEAIPRVPSLMVLKVGTHISVVSAVTDERCSSALFTAEANTEYNIALFLGNRKYTTLSNVKLAITLEDLTASRIYALETAKENLIADNDSTCSLISAMHNLADYDNDTDINVPKGDGSTWRKTLGVYRHKSLVTLNKSVATSASMLIKLSGNDCGVYPWADVTSWATGIMLYANRHYRLRCDLVGGTSVYSDTSDWVPVVTFYEVGDSSSLGSAGRSGKSYVRDLILTENKVCNIAIYLPPSEDVALEFEDASFIVTLAEVDETPSDDVPDYYNDYLPEKITDINSNGLNITSNGLRFIFITDYHVQNNTRKSGALMRKICDNTGIKNVVFGGDAEQSEATPIAGYNAIVDMITDFSSVSEVANMYFITGNHEMNNPSGASEYEDRMIDEGVIGRLFFDQMSNATMLFDQNNSFYVDDEYAKIRVYFIGCDSKAVISVDTRDLVMNSLLTVPASYSVLLISHVGLAWDETSDTESINWRAKNILDVCTAMNDGTTCDVYLGPNNTLHRTFDFTGKQRDFIGMICGHTHRDNCVVHDNRFPVISTACDAYQVASQRMPPPHGQTPGTVYEQCFDVVQIDNVNKRIFMTRIGDGVDRIFHYGENAGPVT